LLFLIHPVMASPMSKHSVTRHPLRRQGRSARRVARGISLLEVLVGLLLFSLGVLGMVGLQASMTQEQTAAKARADAAYLASELVGIMWTDKAHLSSYTTAGCANYTPCADWQNKLAAQLPQGTLNALSVDTSGGATDGNVSITIQWTAPRSGTHQYTTTTTVKSAG
jgi:type IV pilus assembly protein PilV